jgi:hypothetical protein
LARRDCLYKRKLITAKTSQADWVGALENSSEDNNRVIETWIVNRADIVMNELESLAIVQGHVAGEIVQ